jgi:tRNA C32,U32 (ribose-2'-O)-methylase TrmJ
MIPSPKPIDSFEHRLAQQMFRRVLIVGTSPRGTVDYDRFHYRGPIVLCLGHERDGLSPDEQSQCDVLLRIPMVSGQDSLNVSIAGSVILYEMSRCSVSCGSGLGVPHETATAADLRVLRGELLLSGRKSSIRPSHPRNWDDTTERWIACYRN